MIGHITILSILGSTMIVNVASQMQGLPSFARDSECFNVTLYNPEGLDLQHLNRFYSHLNKTCDSQTIDPCTHACFGPGIASCVDNKWAGDCGPTNKCYAYPFKGLVEIGCLEWDNVYRLFSESGYPNGPFGTPSNTSNPPA